VLGAAVPDEDGRPGSGRAFDGPPDAGDDVVARVQVEALLDDAPFHLFADDLHP